MNLRLVLLLLCFGAAGCNHVLRDVKARAAFEFNCPEDQVTASALGGYTYGATGCGRQLTCNDVPFAGLLCSAATAQPPQGAPAPAGAR